MRFSWLKWRPKQWALSVSWPFNGLDAGAEKCTVCEVARRRHGTKSEVGHAFAERP